METGSHVKEVQHRECHHSAPGYGTCVQHDPSHRWKGTSWITESIDSGHTSELKKTLQAAHKRQVKKKFPDYFINIKDLCWTNFDRARWTPKVNSGTHRVVMCYHPHRSPHWPAKSVISGRFTPLVERGGFR